MKKECARLYAVLVVLCMLYASTALGQSPLNIARNARFIEADRIEVEVFITGDVQTTGNLMALGIQERLPTGWLFDALYSETYGEDKAAEVLFRNGELDIFWITIPEFPIRLTYGIVVQTYDSSQSLSGTLYARTMLENFVIAAPTTQASDVACLTVTRTPSSAQYQPGQSVEVNVAVTSWCHEPVSALAIVETLSEPWAFETVSISYATGPEKADAVSVPTSGAVSPFEFIWIDAPSFPIALTYAVTAAEASGNSVTIGGSTSYRLSSGNITAEYPETLLTQTIPEGEGEAPVEGEGEVVEEGEAPVEGEGEVGEEGEGEPVQFGSLAGVVHRAGALSSVIANARVVLSPGGRETASNFFGGYSFTNLPYGTYQVEASASGYETYRINVDIAGTAILLNLPLSPAGVSEGEGETDPVGSLGGFVVDATTSLPIANALVTIMPGGQQTTTNLAGAYLFSNLAYGAYVVAANASGYEPYQTEITINAAAVAATLPMNALTPSEGEGETGPVGVLAGVVLNAQTQLPVAGAEVTIAPGSYSMVTAVNGGFLFTGLAYGTYAMEAALDGFTTYSGVVEINAVFVNTVVFITPEDVEPTKASLVGTVAQAGLPIPIVGAELTLNPGNRESTTNEFGAYLFDELDAGEYQFTASASGFESNTATITITQASVNIRNISMNPLSTEEGETEPVGTLICTVQDANTLLPVGAAEATLDDAAPTSSTFGVFTFVNIAYGNHVLRVQALGYLSEEQTVVVDAPVVAVTVLLSPPVPEEGEGELVGTVVCTLQDAATSLPISNATVLLSGAAPTPTLPGVYTFVGVVYGAHTLQASAEGYQSASSVITVDAPIVPVFLSLSPAIAPEGEGENMEGEGEPPVLGALTGFVLDAATQAPVAGASLLAKPGNLTAVTDADGLYLLDKLPLGLYVVSSSASGYKTLSQTTNLQGPSQQLDFTLTPLATTEGETLPEGEGESPAEGEGESDDSGGCSGCNSCGGKRNLNTYGKWLSDFWLLGIAVAALHAFRRK